MLLEEFLNDVKTGDVVWLSGPKGEVTGFVVELRLANPDWLKRNTIRVSHESPYRILGAMNRENFPTSGNREYRLSNFNEYQILKRHSNENF